MAIRQDIFDATPYYASLSGKIASILLLPDSSLEGSWRSNNNIPAADDSNICMTHTTQVLQEAFGKDATPTGDALFQAIGNLCALGRIESISMLSKIGKSIIPGIWILENCPMILEPSCGVSHHKTTMRDVASFRTSFPCNKSVWHTMIIHECSPSCLMGR
jgi:hypothetical protein